MKIGNYILIRASRNILRDEWTNIGLMLFDDKESLVSIKFSFKRAIDRNDMALDTLGAGEEKLESFYTEMFETLDAVKHFRESTSHSMSQIQFGQILTARLQDNTFQDIFEKLVL